MFTQLHLAAAPRLGTQSSGRCATEECCLHSVFALGENTFLYDREVSTAHCYYSISSFASVAFVNTIAASICVHLLFMF